MKIPVEAQIHLNRFQPRPYQLPILDAIENKDYKRVIAIMPRRAGKDVTAFNLCIRACVRKSCVIYYVFPTYSQAKKVIWDSILTSGERFLDYIPRQLVEGMNSSDMKIRFKNGSLLQLVGSDNFDSLMGTNPQGIVFSEYALQDPRAYQFMRPILAANNGWALFITTPRGKNHAFELYQIALHNPKEWFAIKLTLDDTQHIPAREIDKERAEGIMSEDLIQQEYYCSFTMGVEGSYYAKYLDRMRLEGRIGDVPWDSGCKTNVALDIGVRDSTALIFYQVYGAIVRVIDCYESSKEGLEHYVNIVRSKPYTYGKFIAPHDIRVKEWGSGMTRWDKAKQLGITFTIAEDHSIVDGIETVRSKLSIMYIDQQKCAPLIKALENYRQEYDAKNRIYKPHPLHNFASHYCFTGETLVLTRNGMRQIISIEDDEEVLTLNGWQKCIGAKSTRKNVNVVRVVFADGVAVNCTPDHLFLTTSGWISAGNLSKGYTIQSSLMTNSNHSTEKRIESAVPDITYAHLVLVSTEMSGSRRMGMFRRAVTYITRIATRPIISLLTWSVYLPRNTINYLKNIIRGLVNNVEKPQINGTPVILAENGTAITPKVYEAGKSRFVSAEIVCNAERRRNYCNEKTIHKSFAIPTVGLPMVERVEKVEGLYDVWCINVPNAGHFSLSNGAIVSNSDAMRYLCVSLSKVRDSTDSKELDRRFYETVMGEESNLPYIFRHRQ